ncbi:response regulator transcription factor [Patescibacteria group bacterium]
MEEVNETNEINKIDEINEPITSGKKILFIEDDKTLSQVISGELEKSGFTVKPVFSGGDALRMVRTELPELILLDLMLPEVHGFDILTKIKKDSHTKNIPVIIITALGSDDDVKKGLSLGADDYIVKSKHSVAEIIDKVKSFLK